MRQRPRDFETLWAIGIAQVELPCLYQAALREIA